MANFLSAVGQSVTMSNAQTGNVTATNTVQRNSYDRSALLLQVTTTVGATPTCTYNFDLSPDNSAWYPAPHYDLNTPGAVSLTTALPVLTAAGTFLYAIPGDLPWLYVRCRYTSNTNVTNTLVAWAV